MLEVLNEFEIQNLQAILGGQHGDSNGIPPDGFFR